MKVTKFEDLLAWQKAQYLAVDVYSEFRKNTDFRFKDQLFRSVVSISNNIAEGFDRETKKEFVRFLFIAKGSCGEVKSMLYLAGKLSYIGDQRMNILLSKCEEISKIIRGIIRAIS